MWRKLFVIVFLAWIGSLAVLGQDAEFKNFKAFKGVVPEVDFFASTREVVKPFEKPLTETRERLSKVLGLELPKGAIFVCSSLQQKDSVWEPRVLKLGYSWVLTVNTPEVQQEEMLARLKAQLGDQIPAEQLQRIRSGAAQMRGSTEGAIARTAARNMAYAILQVSSNPTQEFRSSRVDDMGRSPLPDWLDIGLASYASNSSNPGYLQQHLDEAFPLDEVLGMSRPFVPPSAGGGGGGPIMIRMAGPGGAGGAAPPPGAVVQGGAPSGGAPGGGAPGQQVTRRFGPDSLPKEQKDRMFFDAQSSTFFTYLMEKVGVEKVKALVAAAREGKELTPLISGPDYLANETDKIEEAWMVWVKALKVEAPEEFRMRFGGPGGSRSTGSSGAPGSQTSPAPKPPR